MKFSLSRHAWLRFRRSPTLSKDILQTAVLALFGLYAAVSLMALGLVAGELIRTYFPGRDVLNMAGGIMLYYFLLDLLTRFFFQKFPAAAIRPYLLLPVSKTKIAQHLLF